MSMQPKIYKRKKIPVKSELLQVLPREHMELGATNVEMSTQTSIMKDGLETNPRTTWHVKPRCQKTYWNRVPKSFQNRWKSCARPPRNHAAVPMVLLGAGPCLPGAPGLRVSDTVCFPTLIGHAFNYQPSAVKLCTSPRKDVFYHHHPRGSRSVILPKIHKFANLFLAQRNPEKTIPEAHRAP